MPCADTSAPNAQAACDQLLAQDARLWRAAQLGRGDAPCWPSGFAALDAELPGGGWPTQGLSEILQAQAGLAEWRLLGPALARRAGKPLLLIQPPMAPHPAGLRELGLLAHECLWLRPEQPQQALWCTEQAIRSNAALVLAWLDRARPDQLRRLQSAAQDCSSPVFLFRPLAAQAQSSAAVLRLELAPDAQAPAALRLRLIKRRGPPHEGWLRLAALPQALAQRLPARLLERGLAVAPPQPPVPLSPALPHPDHEALRLLAGAAG